MGFSLDLNPIHQYRFCPQIWQLPRGFQASHPRSHGPPWERTVDDLGVAINATQATATPAQSLEASETIENGTRRLFSAFFRSQRAFQPGDHLFFITRIQLFPVLHAMHALFDGDDFARHPEVL